MEVTMGILFLFHCLLNLILISGCHSTGDSEPVLNENEVQEIGSEKFEYVRVEPGNELGIFTKVIAHVFRAANQTTEEYRINREYLPDTVLDYITSSCEQKNKDSMIKWSGCKSDDEGLFAYATWGVPEPKNKTITYLEFNFEAFTKKLDNGDEQVCLLEEVYKTKVYVVLKTYSERPSNSSFPRNYIDSVATVHQHQLDAFGENFMSLFGDKIDEKLIYNFGPDEYYDRDPPYECFLSIASSESRSVIEEKCDFYCLARTDEMSRPMIEKVLQQAKEVANDDEDIDPDDVVVLKARKFRDRIRVDEL